MYGHAQAPGYLWKLSNSMWLSKGFLESVLQKKQFLLAFLISKYPRWVNLQSKNIVAKLQLHNGVLKSKAFLLQKSS